MDHQTDLITVMTPAEAEAITARIIGHAESLVDDLLEAALGRAWEALGYSTWMDYTEDRFSDLRLLRLDRDVRRELVQSLHDEAHLSGRAIAATIGVDEKTVRNDLSSGAEKSAPDQCTAGEARAMTNGIKAGLYDLAQFEPVTPEEVAALERAEASIAVLLRIVDEMPVDVALEVTRRIAEGEVDGNLEHARLAADLIMSRGES